jgi:hypothetical protein
MANKVLLKKSSVGARVPTTSDIDYGELALNYADGKLYYKTSGNAIDSFPSLTATATLTNKTLTTPVVDRIDWEASGTGAPTTTTRSAGTKLTLYPALGASYVDYAIGIDSGTLWSSLPAYDGGQYFKWYGGTTQVASLSGTGVLTVGSINNPNITGTLTAGGGVGEEGQVLTSTVTGVAWTTPAGGGGGSGNSFTTIAVSGQSSVLADSATDTLTLAAAGVIGIITSASTDTITFTTNKSFPFTKYDGNASNIPLYTEASALATSLDTVYLPFAKSDGTSVTTLKLTA